MLAIVGTIALGGSSLTACSAPAESPYVRDAAIKMASHEIVPPGGGVPQLSACSELQSLNAEPQPTDPAARASNSRFDLGAHLPATEPTPSTSTPPPR